MAPRHRGDAADRAIPAMPAVRSGVLPDTAEGRVRPAVVGGARGARGRAPPRSGPLRPPGPCRSTDRFSR
ncbi:hypothetical protein Ae168Ps1_4155 [Pseudonocardia sp. Ae168_Ps1]|nr:hypothetical protein Ae168Ps1_4155 [Pseudonocardia sp. Ae168_Ps1]OLL84141.1 hypothetical protein Ae263Ps1_1196c [Pseudonocardia sp. Ae263_Ps1]